MVDIKERLDRHNLNLRGLRAVSFAVLVLTGLGLIYTNAVIPAYNRHADIITNEYATYINNSDYLFLANVFAIKGIDCVYYPQSERGYILIEDIWVETLFRYVDDATPDSTRPKGPDYKDFGVWEWHHQRMDEADETMVTVKHICNAVTTLTKLPDGSYTENTTGDIRITPIGPFDIDELKLQHELKLLEEQEKQNED